MINVWLPKKLKIVALGFQRNTDFIPIEKLLPMEIRELSFSGCAFAVKFNNGRTVTLKEDWQHRRIVSYESPKPEEHMFPKSEDWFMARKAAYFFLLRQDWLNLPDNLHFKNVLDMTDAGTYNNFNLGVSDEI